MYYSRVSGKQRDNGDSVIRKSDRSMTGDWPSKATAADTAAQLGTLTWDNCTNNLSFCLESMACTGGTQRINAMQSRAVCKARHTIMIRRRDAPSLSMATVTSLIFGKIPQVGTLPKCTLEMERERGLKSQLTREGVSKVESRKMEI
jgi:hypothetical protein